MPSDTDWKAWENRKERVVQSIRENDFDFFGLQECSTDIQTYLADELDDTYNIRFFSPYSQDGNGNKAQGLAYKKAWTLTDWHYFWLSDTPGTMCQNDSDANGNYNRGGCCGVLSKDDKHIFVMVTHGALNSDVRAEYAHVYEDMEKLYNTSGYPCIFVGDMNAQPSDASSVAYRTYWTDTYDGVGSAGRLGPYSTFNGFNLSRNMYSDPHRIDYIYYRGAITPLNYVCNGTKYDDYYASDHLPVYSNMRLE
jgi:endonuclease/exonuclease/phosphatase family metal-dependent hydrolase